MTISSAVSNATSGLSAAARRADIVSNNIANALTPGFARRDLIVGEQILDGKGAGVSIAGVARAADASLTRERRSAEGVQGRDNVVASAYASLNDALGEPDDPFSLFGQYQNLETALRSLAETPESTPLQAETVEAARSLAASFNQISTKIRDMRENADAEIGRNVDFINTALKRVEALNADISQASAGGRDTAALFDQRKTLIDQISAIMPVRELPRDGGAVDLMTNEGVFLLAGTARKIEFTPKGVITPDLSLAGGALSGLAVDGVDITPGGGANVAARQGKLAGLFEIRDSIIPNFQSQIDALARDVMQRFEGLDATLAPGDAGLFTDSGAAFDPAKETGLAGRIALNAAADPGQGGEYRRIRDGLGSAAPGPAGSAVFIRSMLDAFVEQRAVPAGAGLASNLSAGAAVAGVSSLVGVARVAAEASLASSSARAQAVIDSETAVTSVDSDQEMQKLIVIEQAYAANARVLQTAQAMMRVLMEI
jgi:flagellar hook-associated protein 1 FlgK